MRRVCWATLLLLSVSACMPMGRTFDATTTSDGYLKASDAASHSKAKIVRDGRTMTVQDAYRFDLGTLVDVDQDFRAPEVTDEGRLTRDEAIVSTAIHGAFGMGVFKPVLDKLDSPWVKTRMARTHVGRPFFVRSLSPKRDDFYVVPVFYGHRWAVSSHVGISSMGRFYSNGFTIPNMPIEASSSTTVFGRANLDRWLAQHADVPIAEPERVFVETAPPQGDAMLGAVWLVRLADGMLCIDPEGRSASLSHALQASIEAGKRLDGPVAFSPK